MVNQSRELAAFKIPEKMNIRIYTQFPLEIPTSQYLPRNKKKISKFFNFTSTLLTVSLQGEKIEKKQSCLRPFQVADRVIGPRKPDADYCKAFINRNVAPPKSKPASPKLTRGEEVFNYITCIIPSSPQRIPTSPIPIPCPGDATVEDDEEGDFPEYAIVEDNEEENESVSLGTTDTVTSPNQERKKNGAAASDMPEFDYNFNSRRPIGPPIKPISALLDPNELSVFDPSSRVEPSHKIRERMMTWEFRGGLGHHVNWERKEKRRLACAFEERGRRRCQIEGPRTGDDDDYLEEDDPERDDTWNQFDEMDYHARGW